jgi:hypothetical protein
VTAASTIRPVSDRESPTRDRSPGGRPPAGPSPSDRKRPPAGRHRRRRPSRSVPRRRSRSEGHRQYQEAHEVLTMKRLKA